MWRKPAGDAAAVAGVERGASLTAASPRNRVAIVVAPSGPNRLIHDASRPSARTRPGRTELDAEGLSGLSGGEWRHTCTAHALPVAATRNAAACVVLPQ